VSPDGTKTWLVRYSFDGIQKQTRLPKPFGKGAACMSLVETRAQAAHIQSQAKSGIDTVAQTIADKLAAKAIQTQQASQNLTLADLFESWVLNGTGRKDGGKELRRSFSKDILPVLGSCPLKQITAVQIREALRTVVARGANRTAVVLLTDIQQMFRWGSDEQPWRKLLIEGDPAKRIEAKTLVSPSYDLSNERDRVLSDDEIRQLHGIFKAMTEQYQAAPDKRVAVQPVVVTTQIALWLCLSTTCRIGELLMSRWEHIDFEQSVWYVPKENSKATQAKRVDWTVQLSDFACEQFKRLHALTGYQAWCFPATNKDNHHVCLKSISKQVGDRQTSFKNRTALKGRRNDDSLVLSSKAWTPHDLRRTGSTLMQVLGIEEGIRERCLNHAVGGKIGRIYGRHNYEHEKRAAWQKLGLHLEGLLTSAALQISKPPSKRKIKQAK
jgi:integrase